MVKPLGYEVNIDGTKDIIEALIDESFDPKVSYFVTYDVARLKMNWKSKSLRQSEK